MAIEAINNDRNKTKKNNMKKTQKIELLYENGNTFDEVEISYLFSMPRILIIDDKYYIQQFHGFKYQQTTPQVYKSIKKD